jgi:hypothetical protein
MKYKNYKGHKVFCNCNASFENDICRKMLTCEGEYAYPKQGKAADICPDCGCYPWYYFDVKYEPK